MSLNVWTFTGRLGRDAESKYLPNGTAVLEFSPAVDVGFGEKKSTLWPRCALFGPRGEKLVQYLTKGQLVAVSGELSVREYTNSSGVTKTSLDVRVDKVELLSKRDDSQGYSQPAARPAATQPAAQRQSRSAAPIDDYDDDSIPF
jgi:single-strand DNA-binding protein